MKNLLGQCTAIALALGTAWAAQAAPAEGVVGEITLAVGQAQVISAGGTATPATRGTPLRVGDRIETISGGQAMVRFIDGGLVSVRAGSRLTVEAYQYDPARPQDSTIKMSLTEGVTRSITGRGGEAARERFRLNTPVAAIGVKGTDFVAQAQPDTARVRVYQGAVVVAPFGGGCTMDGTGPCANGTSKVLADAAGAMMVEVNRRNAAPQMIALAGNTAGSLGHASHARNGRFIDDDSGRKDDGVTVAGIRNETITLARATAIAATEADTLVVLASAPTGGHTASFDTPASMTWGRWSWTPRREGDKMTVSALDLFEKGLESTVSNEYAVLMRPRDGTALSSSLGRVSLALTDGAVSLKQGESISAGQLTGGSLSLNFTNWTFATQLGVAHPAIAGATVMTGGGVIRSDGVFVGRETGGGNIAGAVNGKATEAGYLFDKNLPQGQLSGVTLWRR